MVRGAASGAGASENLMTIGQVLERLSKDFPGISHAKLRFLESEGLVVPQRTGSGYRKYSEKDVTRLHYALTLQRDHYRPLKVIKEHLEALDRGLEPPVLNSTEPVVPPVALARDGLPNSDSFRPDSSTLRLSRRELLATADVDDELLTQLETYGLVTARPGSAPYDADALLVTKTAAELASFGIEPRHLRAFKTAADREVGLIEQVASPIRRSREAGAEGRAEETITQIAALSVRLHSTLVKAGLRSLR